MIKVHILAVMVRYKTPLDQSETMLGLCQAFKDAPELAESIGVFLWDNTPEPLKERRLPDSFEYGHTGENLGVSGAYNRAMDVADAHGSPWMLLLDQDTSVDAPFLRRMLELSHEVQGDAEVGCVVPFMRSEGQLVSPRRLGRLNRVTQVERGFSGILRGNAYAINSASLMRVSALREIGGYSEEFWLDLSDVYACQRLHQQGRFMYVAGDLELDHSIGGLNFEKGMVPERYETFLAAENAYLGVFQSRFENGFHTFRILVRTLRQYLEYKDRAYARITWRCFLLRLFKPRAVCLKQWRGYLLNKRSIPSVSYHQPSRAEEDLLR